MTFIFSVASAFWLGVLTSISPCPLASNVAAISYLAKEVDRPRRVLLSGILYSLGCRRDSGSHGASKSCQVRIGLEDRFTYAQCYLVVVFGREHPDDLNIRIFRQSVLYGFLSFREEG